MIENASRHSSRTALILVAAAALLLSFFALGRQFADTNSQTYDEAVHLTAGYSYLATGDFRINPEHPPLIKELSALPIYLRYHLPWTPDQALWNGAGTNPEAEWLLGQNFLYKSSVDAHTMLFQSRLVNLLLGVLLVGLVGWWSYRLWGRGAALVGMTLAAFDPNLIAHSSLVTTDLGTALFIFLAVYLLWEYQRRSGWPLLLGVALSAGLALITKYSGVVVIGILGVLIGIEILRGESFGLPSFRKRIITTENVPQRVLNGVALAMVISVLAALVIPLGYKFQGFSDWWRGFSDIVLHQQKGHDAFLLGQYSTSGWWYYYPIAFLVKTPIGSMLLVAMALFLPRRDAQLNSRDATYLLVPALLFAAVMMQSHVNIGVRHILPVYPFLFVLASRMAVIRLSSRMVGTLMLAIPLLMTVVSSLRIAPHQLAYFNEAIGGPSQGPNYLSDSNIDWGQDLWGLEQYLREQQVDMIEMACAGNWLGSSFTFKFQQLPAIGPVNPMPPDLVPASEHRQLLAISVMNLQGMYFPYRTVYSWLLQRTPVANIGHSIFVYDISRDADAHLQLAKLYLEDDGQQRYARAELEKAVKIEPTNAEALNLLHLLQVGEK